MKSPRILRFVTAGIVLSLTVTVLGGALNSSAANSKSGKWVAGDFHTHTYLTDGSKTEIDVLNHAFGQFGLDWMANSEHGGTSKRDPLGNSFTSPIWRWLTLKNYSYPLIKDLRNTYTNKLLIQGLEWNVPTHEHASIGIVANEPTSISDFEYMFDQSDKDTSRASEGLAKQNVTHQNAISGAKWLESNYKNTSYFILNHPSRALKYSISDIRDFNNAAPDVAFGLEGMPGHQKESSRGGYGSSDPNAQTYGGADMMIAKVGGVWDALLGEGRKFYTYVNSDFHSDAGDFWPGEYAKSYTYVKGNAYTSLVAGLRSGNSFAVHGDLINALDFNVKNRNNSATMGETLSIDKVDNAVITIRFKSPSINNNGDRVKVDHIDLIAGEVTGKTQPGTPEYSKATNDTAKVIARFTSKDMKKEDGWNVITYNLKDVDKNMYFRLRGTNLGLNVQNETDAQGNPLNDSLMGTNDASKAYKDLWFYSNPIFVDLSK